MERLIRSIDQTLSDRRATSLATTGSHDEAAAPAAPATASPVGDADMPDLAVFSDAPSAPELVVVPAGEFMMDRRKRRRAGTGTSGLSIA